MSTSSSILVDLATMGFGRSSAAEASLARAFFSRIGGAFASALTGRGPEKSGSFLWRFLPLVEYTFR